MTSVIIIALLSCLFATDCTYIGTGGTTFVAFSTGNVLFSTSIVEFVSLIVVIGRSEVVGVCA
ncbi:protein of unknown function [Candidatus Nitrosocosmicus franklandus]|uniref:Uncharacterized protein n=1 Tax=Candidatus Nitrosocosmicus franklandianus TaxID=1798806 RepID=A0A484IEA0_9ARCH|nr:protein of unknown function [Candidatus Nitrosocosmicus franklandus]